MVREGQPFKKNKKGNGTIFSSEKMPDDVSLQQTNTFKGSTTKKNSQTMDKSLDESEDDINNYPAYIKHNKNLEDKRLGSNKMYFTNAFQQFEKPEMLEDSHGEDFPDELSKELYRYKNKESARV